MAKLRATRDVPQTLCGGRPPALCDSGSDCLRSFGPEVGRCIDSTPILEQISIFDAVIHLQEVRLRSGS